MPQPILTGGWIFAVLAVFLPAIVHADPLPAATWTESVTLKASALTNNYLGVDNGLPEPLTGTLSSSSYVIDGNVAFGEPGPPSITVHAHLSTGGNYSDDYHATSQSAVSFDFQIVQTHLPPVAVDYVPILITSRGSVYAAGSCDFYCTGGTAQGSMVVTTNGAEVFNEAASVNVKTGSSQQVSLDATKAISVQPGTVLHGTIQVFTTAGVEILGANASGTASLGSGFDITSAFIPGTEYQYRDFFQIEYSPGYFALGNPIPVIPATWGKLKSLYSKP